MAKMLILFLGVAVAGSAVFGLRVVDGLDTVPELCLQSPEVWCKELVTAAECKREGYSLAKYFSWPSLWEEGDEEEQILPLWKKCLRRAKLMQEYKDLIGDNLDDDMFDAALISTCKALGRLLRQLCRIVMKMFKNALEDDGDAQGANMDVGRHRCTPPGWTVSAESGLVPEACLQSQEFWCKDMIKATACKKKEYCWISLWPGKLAELEEELHHQYIKCNLCVRFMQKFKALTGDNPSKKKIDIAVHNLCHILGKFFGEGCERVMRQFKNIIVPGLQKNDDACKLCVDIKICKAAPSGIPEAPINEAAQYPGN